MIIKKQRILFSFLFIALLFFAQIPAVWGHSYVVDESPKANSHLEQSPDEVKVTFSSKIEKDLFTIKVINQQQQIITNKPPKISDNQKEIMIELPTLEGGNYTVQYYVVSSNDGHPIQGSFHFSVASFYPVNEGNEKEPTLSINEPLNKGMPEKGEPLQPTPTIPNELTPSALNTTKLTEMLIYVMRTLYYMGLLVLVGWIFWWRTIQHYAIDVKKKYLFWGIIFQMVHLVGLISVILVQMNMFTINGLSFSGDIPMNSTFGLLWFMTLFMSLIGFIFLFKNQSFDLFWIFVIVICKSSSGHALEFEPTAVLVAVNSIHLMVATVWAAGLTFIMLFWRKHRLYVTSFLPIFSKYAFVSIIVLVITGAYLTFNYFTSMDLLLSERGIVLFIKLFLTMLVILIGGVIRSKVKAVKQANLEKWIRLDFIIMLLIVIVVSILTYLNPLP